MTCGAFSFVAGAGAIVHWITFSAIAEMDPLTRGGCDPEGVITRVGDICIEILASSVFICNWGVVVLVHHGAVVRHPVRVQVHSLPVADQGAVASVVKLKWNIRFLQGRKLVEVKRVRPAEGDVVETPAVFRRCSTFVSVAASPGTFDYNKYPAAFIMSSHHLNGSFTDSVLCPPSQ